MIKSSQPLTIAEVKEIVKTNGTEVKDMEHYLKEFSTLKLKDSQEIKKELNELEILGLKESDIIKIIDFLPEDKEDLNKIVVDVSLSEEDVTKLLDIVKKYR